VALGKCCLVDASLAKECVTLLVREVDHCRHMSTEGNASRGKAPWLAPWLAPLLAPLRRAAGRAAENTTGVFHGHMGGMMSDFRPALLLLVVCLLTVGLSLTPKRCAPQGPWRTSGRRPWRPTRCWCSGTCACGTRPWSSATSPRSPGAFRAPSPSSAATRSSSSPR
jgi:hypothetical protein